MSKPLILVANDDGVFAKGIKSLVEAVLPLGDIVVVAPDSPQSAMGHAVTIHDPIRMREVNFPVDGVRAYSTSGTPVDCVKMAIHEVLDRKPDLLVSGINHGANHSINVIYSGTMSAAVEGAIEGIPSIGFSLLDFAQDADFTAAAHFSRIIAKEAIAKGIAKHTCLNVNVPKVSLEDIKGIKICRQAEGNWSEAFAKRQDPSGHNYYWMQGNFKNPDKAEDTDQWALDHGYVSIVPVQYDMTAYHTMADLNQWNLND